MRVTVAAIGRMKKGPEQDLITRYGDRIRQSGKSIGISELDVREISESRAGTAVLRQQDEESTLLEKIGDHQKLIVFDERGKRDSSRQFASNLQNSLDTGIQNCVFIIGGPDGLSQNLRDRADRVVSFGSLTMPHQIVRVLVLEQIYRATTILTNHPYHRD